MNKRLLIFALLVGSLAAIGPAQTYQPRYPASDGVIQGRVLNDQGKPILGARVVALPMGPGGGLVPVTYTNRRGRFLFRGMTPQEYALYSLKENKASQMIFDRHFSNDPRVVRVPVQEHQTIKGVELQLLPRQATISGQMVDSETGRPVETAQLKLCHFGSAPSCFLDHLNKGGCDECVFLPANRSQGGFSQLAPSNIPLTIKVSAPGYEDWYYGNGSNRQEPFALAPGENRKLAITLRPKGSAKN